MAKPTRRYHTRWQSPRSFQLSPDLRHTSAGTDMNLWRVSWTQVEALEKQIQSNVAAMSSPTGTSPRPSRTMRGAVSGRNAKSAVGTNMHGDDGAQVEEEDWHRCHVEGQVALLGHAQSQSVERS